MTGPQPRGEVVVAVSWTTSQSVLAAFQSRGPHVLVMRLSSDWGKGRFARLLLLVRSTFRVFRAARRADKLVLVTVGYEVFVAVVLLRMLRAKLRPALAVADFLLPGSRRLGVLQGWLLRRVDEWACVRRGDISTLESLFGVAPERCAWVPFPLSAGLEELEAVFENDVDGVRASAAALTGQAGDYVYSAGNAHRDWPLVLDALRLVGCPAILGVDPDHPDLRGRPVPSQVAVVGRLPPEQGRSLAAAAAVVVVALRDTHLPAGPLVLADAMALGRAVVATDVNGTRDYVEDGTTALVVPPDDPIALADAVRALLSDEPLRERLGAAARAWATARLQPDDFARAVLHQE